MLAAAREDLHAEFILEQADLLADPGLGGIKALRGGRYVEVVMGNLPDVTQLLQLHRPRPDTSQRSW